MNPEKIYSELYRFYGPQGWWPVIINSLNIEKDKRGYHKNNPLLKHNSIDRFEILTGAVLTQNTTWKNAETSIRNLKEEGICTAEKFLNSEEKKIKALIKSSGYYNQKYRKLKIVLKYMLDEGFIESSSETISAAGNGTAVLFPERTELLSLWGIGEETADSILLYAYNLPSFVIDKYTIRISERLMPEAALKLKNYKDYKYYYENHLDTDVLLFNEFHALIVKHAVEVCRKKPICSKCFLRDKCAAGLMNNSYV